MNKRLSLHIVLHVFKKSLFGSDLVLVWLKGLFRAERLSQTATAETLRGWRAVRSYHTAAPTQSHTQRHLSKCQRRFSCRTKYAEYDGNEGITFPLRQQWVDWAEMGGLCHPGLFPEQRDRKWLRILGGHKPSSVPVYQTTIGYFIQRAQEPVIENMEGLSGHLSSLYWMHWTSLWTHLLCGI